MSSVRPAPLFFSLRRALRAVLVAACAGALAGCLGGGDGDEGAGATFDPMPVRVVTPGVHQVALPVGSHSEVRIQVVDLPELSLLATPIRGEGPVNLTVPAEFEDRLLRITISPIDPRVEQQPETVDTTQSTQPEQAVLLVTGRQLNRGGLSFNPLSDYIARRIDDYQRSTTDERLAYMQDGLANEFIAYDLDGDGKVDINDVMAFDANEAEHLRRLKFDYAAQVSSVLAATGQTLMQSYASRPDRLSEALYEAFEGYEFYALPSAEMSNVAVLHVDSNRGGAVTIDELNGIVLDEGNSRLLQRDPLGGTPRQYRLRAHAEEGWRFVQWADCDQVQVDGSCLMTADVSKHVSALFGYKQNILSQATAGVVRLLDFAAGSYTPRLSDDGTVLYLDDVTDANLNAQLAQVGVSWAIATGWWRQPLLQVTQAPQPPTAQGAGLNYAFTVSSISYLDAYQALSTFAGDQPPSIFEISDAKVELYEDEDEAPSDDTSTMAARNIVGGRGAAPHDGMVWLTGYGYAVDAGHGYYLMQDAQGTGLVLAKANGEARDVPTEQIPMRLYGACAAQPGGPECGLLSGNAPRPRAMMPKAGANCFILDACGIKLVEIKWTGKKWGDSGSGLSGTLGGSLTIEANIDLNTAHSSMHFMWSALPPALDFAMNMRGMITASIGAKMFAGLQGKYVATENIVLVGKEAYLKERKEAQEALTRERREAFERHIRVADEERYNDAQVGKEVSAPGIDALVSALDEEEGRQRSNAMDFGNEGRSRSNAIDLTSSGRPRSNAFAFRFEGDKNAQSTDRRAAGVSFVLNRGTPDGAVMPLTFKLDVGVRGKGKLGVEASAAIVTKIPFDVDVDIGSRCHADKVWFVTVTNCDSKPQRFQMHSQLKPYFTFSAQAVANAEVGPYAEISLNYGPAFVKEDLIKISASVAEMYSVVGNASWSYSTLPSEKAQYAGVPDWCVTRAKASFAMGADIVLGAKGEFDASLSPTILGKQFKINLFQSEFFKYEKKFPIFEPFVRKANFNSGDEGEACLPASQRPARFFPDEVVWRPGELKWDEPNYVMTKTRKLELRENGGFVLSRLTRSGGGQGGVSSETPLTGWDRGAPDTSTHPGARVEFQADGNLVVYDLAERPLWSSGTYRRPDQAANMRLVLQRDGNMVIYEGQQAIWTSRSYGS